MLSLLTDPSDPKMGGLSIAAHVTGVFAAYGILAALAARERTGAGQFVDASLLQASMGFIESHFAEFLNGGKAVTPKNFQRGRLFCLPAGDGRPLLVHLATHRPILGGPDPCHRASRAPGRPALRHVRGPSHATTTT